MSTTVDIEKHQYTRLMADPKPLTISTEQSLSLLEQCVLYNSTSYHPFSDTANATTKPLVNSESAKIVERSSEAQSNTIDQRSIDPSWLTSIDLDFSKPLPEGRSFCQLVTPLFSSTNRRHTRSKSTKAHFGNCYGMCCVQRRKKQSFNKDLRQENEPIPHETTTKGFDFLSLPGEIRNMIFSSLFENARLYISHFPFCQHAFDAHLSIRATCRKIQVETDRIFFDRFKVYVIRDSRTPAGESAIDNIPKKLPPALVRKLQSLVVLSAPANPVTPNYLSLQAMPALRYLKIVETHISHFGSSRSWNHHIERHLDNLNPKGQTESKHPWSWLKPHLKGRDQFLMIEFEKELWAQSSGLRGAHMGALWGKNFLTVLITQSQQPIQTIRKVELTLDQFEKRCEMYTWMKKEDIHISHLSHTSTLLRRLEHMRYHSMLDTIEAGTAKLKIAGKP